MDVAGRPRVNATACGAEDRSPAHRPFWDCQEDRVCEAGIGRLGRSPRPQRPGSRQVLGLLPGRIWRSRSSGSCWTGRRPRACRWSGRAGCWTGVSKTVLWAAPDAEMTGHLGYDKAQRPPFLLGIHRNGTSPKTCSRRSARSRWRCRGTGTLAATAEGLPLRGLTSSPAARRVHGSGSCAHTSAEAASPVGDSCRTGLP